MIGILGIKIGMTSVFLRDRFAPCTVIQVGTCMVTQIKNIEKDGYEAVQLGYEEKKVKNTSKALQGHFNKAGVAPKRMLVEFKNFTKEYKGEDLKLGTQIKAESVFEEGEFVDIVGTSKGKGFTGVVKRHGFKGVGDRTHGQHNRERAPGSIGAGSDPSRVFKGTRMAGRSGTNRVKVKNLEIVKILPAEGLVIVKGAIPGAKKNYIILQK